MIKKPSKCCACGSYEHTVPMAINGRVRAIDYCIALIVAALNAGGIKTIASCCGHGKLPPTIIMEDDTWLVVMLRDEGNKYLERRKRRKQ